MTSLSGWKRLPLLADLGVATWLVGGLLLIIGVHLADVMLRGPRSGSVQERLVSLVALMLLPTAFLAFSGAIRLVRGLIVGTVGLAALTLGLVACVPHLLFGQLAGTDFTGVLATVAGGVLFGLAFPFALAERRRRTWLVAIVVTLVVVVQWALFPTAMTAMHVNAPRVVVPSASTLA